MSLQTKQLYANPDGDRWWLARYSDSGRVFIKHAASVASGGEESTIELAEFLGRPGNPPEMQALVRLIGSLVSRELDDTPAANSN
ncbi:MAG TPA: hypothetical protein VH743_05645 [Beijerinckiaceae bacterium]|jgi:hypothetical protein